MAIVPFNLLANQSELICMLWKRFDASKRHECHAKKNTSRFSTTVATLIDQQINLWKQKTPKKTSISTRNTKKENTHTKPQPNTYPKNLAAHRSRVIGWSNPSLGGPRVTLIIPMCSWEFRIQRSKIYAAPLLKFQLCESFWKLSQLRETGTWSWNDLSIGENPDQNNPPKHD